MTTAVDATLNTDGKKCLCSLRIKTVSEALFYFPQRIAELQQPRVSMERHETFEVAVIRATREQNPRLFAARHGSSELRLHRVLESHYTSFFLPLNGKLLYCMSTSRLKF